MIRPFDGLLFLALATEAAIVAVQRKPRRIRLMDFEYAIMALFAYVVINGLVRGTTGVAFKETVQGAEFVFLMVLVGVLVRRPSRMKLFMRTLFVALTIAALATATICGWSRNWKSS